jgi:hypothetical protein
MKKILIILLALGLVVGLTTGCKSGNSGAREFIPGKGWVPVK